MRENPFIGFLVYIFFIFIMIFCAKSNCL